MVPLGGGKGRNPTNMEQCSGSWAVLLQDVDPQAPKSWTQSRGEIHPKLPRGDHWPGEGAAGAGRALGLLPVVGRAGPFNPGSSWWCWRRVGGLCPMALTWDPLAPAAALRLGALSMAGKLPSYRAAIPCRACNEMIFQVPSNPNNSVIL